MSLALWDQTVLPVIRRKWTLPALPQRYRSQLGTLYQQPFNTK